MEQSGAAPPPGMPRRTRRRRRSSGSRADRRVYEPQPQQQQQQQLPPVAPIDFDSAYFDYYAHVGVHEEMIKDSVRTEAYKTAIMHHRDFIAGKVVLDVGCGTGILSIFCAQAGAKRVYAVEASGIAVQARNVVQANNLSDIVMVLHGQVEDVEIDEKVDVIISEWMGYMLLHENMLGSVIIARDRWLKPGGLILPSIAKLYMAPFTHTSRYSESIDFWRNVYGIDMSAMMSLAKQHAFEEPSVETITGENVLTWPLVVKYVNCHSISISELKSITTKFKLKSMMKAPLHGFAFWFDVQFTGPILSPMPISVGLPTSPDEVDPAEGSQKPSNLEGVPLLSTAPEEPPTHWKQTLVYYYDPIELEQGQLIEGSVTLSQNRGNPRFVNIELRFV